MKKKIVLSQSKAHKVKNNMEMHSHQRLSVCISGWILFFLFLVVLVPFVVNPLQSLWRSHSTMLIIETIQRAQRAVLILRGFYIALRAYALRLRLRAQMPLDFARDNIL